MKKFLVLDGFFEGLRLLTGAVSAVFLMSRGVPLTGLAQLKMLQSVAALLLEFPCGVLSDHFGHRSALALSAVSGASAFFLYRSGNEFLHFAAAEILVALCLALWSGAFEAYALNVLPNKSQPSVNRFFHLNAAVNSSASIITGAIGGYLFSQRTTLPYDGSTIGLGLIAISILLGFPKEKALKGKPASHSILAQARGAYRAVLKQPNLRGPLLMTGVIQVLVQPLIFFWQPMFQKQDLGTVYISFQTCLCVAGIIAARLTKHSWSRGRPFHLSLWFLFGTLAYVFSHAQSTWGAIALFCGMEVCFSLSSSALKAEIGLSAPRELVSSVYSVVALVGKLGGFLSLGIISICVSDNTQTSLKGLFSSIGIASIVFAFALFKLQPIRVKVRNYASHST